MRTLLVNLNAEMMDHLEGFPYVELTRRPGAGNVVRLRGVKEESERTSKLYPKGNNRKNASFVISGKYAHSIGMQHGVRYRLEPATSGTKDRSDESTLYFVARMLGEIPKAGERGRKERLEFPVMTVTERIKKNKAQREAAAAERAKAKAAATKTTKPAEAPKAPEKRVWSPTDVKGTAPVAARPPAPTGIKPFILTLTRDALSLFAGFDRIQVFRRISGNNRGTVALRGTKLEQPNNNNSGVYPIQQQGRVHILAIPTDDMARLGLPTEGVRYALPLSAQKADQTGGPIYNLKVLTEQPPAGTPMATLAQRGQKVDALPPPERAEDKTEPKAAPAEVPAEPAPLASAETAEPVADAALVEAPVSAEPATEPAPETPAPVVEPPVLAAPVAAIPPLPADASPTDLLGVVQVMFGNMQMTIQALATAQQQSSENLASVLRGVQDSNVRLAKVLEAQGTDRANHERRIETLEKQLADRTETAAPAANPRPAAGTKPAVAAKAGETHRH